MAKNVHFIVKEIVVHLEPRYESAAHANTVAWWLLERLTKKSKLILITEVTLHLEEEDIRQLNAWISAHLEDNYPLQYILGSVMFGPLHIAIEPPTLIPRVETEEWVASLINTLEPVANESFTILDMCTGSGCIALWLAKAFPHAAVVAADISPQALALAKKNAAHNNITNIRFVQSDLFTAFDQAARFDLIVSNPPYINPQEWSSLSPVVTKWEDPKALMADNQGLAILMQLISQAPYYINQQSVLRAHGLPKLITEIGYDQGEAVKQLFIDAGFGNAKIFNDNAGVNRIVSGW